mmetsp:Transcript_36868/g.97944  ORF Transcript_36868/g.97944 Transcript_36868/m.97944 type:complete len:209 (-) Transcript_36868:860-1486(-)
MGLELGISEGSDDSLDHWARQISLRTQDPPPARGCRLLPLEDVVVVEQHKLQLLEAVLERDDLLPQSTPLLREGHPRPLHLHPVLPRALLRGRPICPVHLRLRRLRIVDRRSGQAHLLLARRGSSRASRSLRLAVLDLQARVENRVALLDLLHSLFQRLDNFHFGRDVLTQSLESRLIVIELFEGLGVELLKHFIAEFQSSSSFPFQK